MEDLLMVALWLGFALASLGLIEVIGRLSGRNGR